MGNNCTTCQECSESPAVEYVVGPLYLERYQNEWIQPASLGKEDQFFRVVCSPLHKIHASVFFESLESIERKHQKLSNANPHDTKSDGQTKEIVSDTIPLSAFMDYFRSNDLWNNELFEDGRFLKMLLLEDFTVQKEDTN